MSSAEPGTEQLTPTDGVRNSWVPTIGLFLAQMLMSFNVAARHRRGFRSSSDDSGHGGRDRFFALLNGGRQD